MALSSGKHWVNIVAKREKQKKVQSTYLAQCKRGPGLTAETTARAVLQTTEINIDEGCEKAESLTWCAKEVPTAEAQQ